MTTLLRSAKSGSEWTSNDLVAYNIHSIHQNATEFFGMAALPPPTVDAEILTVESADDMNNDKNSELIYLLDLAMSTVGPEESCVDDFAVDLFKALGYVHRHRVARTRKDIPLFMCGEWTRAKTDVCLVDRLDNDILLLVQEDKRYGVRISPEAQLIAETIAAFQYNNALRKEAGLDPIDSKVMPGITMLGTTPTFYKIPINSELIRCIQFGEYPSTPTSVVFHVPAVARPNRRWSEGMKPLDNRRTIIQCYEAFKQFVF